MSSHYACKARIPYVFAIALAVSLAFLAVSQCLIAEDAYAETDANLKSAKMLSGDKTSAKKSSAKKQVKIPISKCKIVKMKRYFKYTAHAHKPLPRITYKGKKLKQGRDYRLYYKNNTAIGKATMYVEGKGKYSGKTKRNFKIKFSNIAIAVAACRISYSQAKFNGASVNPSHGYPGTIMYYKYADRPFGYSCSRAVRMAIGTYLRIQPQFPRNTQSMRSFLDGNNDWVTIGTYRRDMEFEKNNKLRPGDVFNDGSHTCMYVGSDVARTVYREYLETTKEMKGKLGKRCADLGIPAKNAVWVASHQVYMGGSAAHICSRTHSLASTGGRMYRYVGKGNSDPNGVTKTPRDIGFDSWQRLISKAVA